MTEVKAASGAKLRHYKLDDDNRRSQHLSSTMIDLADKVDYLAVTFADGASLARYQTFLSFNGEASRALLRRPASRRSPALRHDAGHQS